MDNQKEKNPFIFKLFAFISLTLIPLIALILILFDINKDPLQILIMSISFLSLSWINWSIYKEKKLIKRKITERCE